MFNFVLFVEITAAFWLGVFLAGCIVIDAAQDKRYARYIRRWLMVEWQSKPSRVQERSEK